MTKPRIAINGFGRIGRTVTRIAKQNRDFEIIAINDLANPEYLAYAFKYDSTFGVYPGSVALEGDQMVIDGDGFKVLSERDPAKLPWRELGIDYVIESTGVFRHVAQLQQHIDAGARRVIVTVPTKDALDATCVLGVNDHVVTADATILSNASCTTNCSAPVAMVLHRAFGIKRGMLTTIHAYTADQRLIDSPHKDMRRSRSAAVNIIPTTTGAARAIGRVIPELLGKLDGFAMRVPVVTGSVIDLTVTLEKDTDAATINAEMKLAAEGPLKGILQYSDDALVSSDIIGNPHSSIFDAPMTQVIDGNMAKVVSWYDNEFGYCSRVNQLVHRLADLDK